MKKYIVSLIAAATAAAISSAQAATTATNVVQPISISLEFVSQVTFTNNGVAAGYSLSDVSRTNKTSKTTNITETVTSTFRSVTNKIANKDIVAALNPSLAGGALVRVWTLISIEGASFYEPQFQIRKGTNIYVVPSSGSGSIEFIPSAFAEVGKSVIVTNTLISGTNIVNVAKTNSTLSVLVIGSLTLNTPTLSCTVSGTATESGQVVATAGGNVHVQNISAGSVAGTGSDAEGNNEVVSGSITVSSGKAED